MSGTPTKNGTPARPAVPVLVVAGDDAAGRAFAEALQRRGYRVTVVPAETVSPGALRTAGAGQCLILVAAAGRDDANLIATVLARREFGVPRVVARVYDPAQAWLYTAQLGVDVALDDAELLAQLVAEELTPAELASLARLRRGGFALIEETVPPDSAALHRPLSEVPLPANCTLVAIWRGGETLSPRRDLELAVGDVLLAAVRQEQPAALAAALSPRAPAPPIEVIPVETPAAEPSTADTQPLGALEPAAEPEPHEDEQRWKRPAPETPAAPPSGGDDAHQTPG